MKPSRFHGRANDSVGDRC